MIDVGDIITRVAADLDAEGSDRYLFEQDYKPAINRAVNWAVAVLQSAFNENKAIADKLSDLKKVRVYKSSIYSRVVLEGTGNPDTIWTVLSVIVKGNFYPTHIVAGAPVGTTSVFMSNLTYLSDGKPCTRRTEEEWEDMKSNVFLEGNTTQLHESLVKYGYLELYQYGGSGYQPGGNGKEIEISPAVNNEFVAVRYLKNPDPIEVEGDQVEFPTSMINILSAKTLNFISNKQGDQTSINTVTAQDIAEMIAALR